MGKKRKGHKVGSSWYTYHKVGGKRRRVKVTKKAKGKYSTHIVGAKRKRRKKVRYSVKLDRARKAKKPGKRRSKSGKIYYESRRNRSDKGKWL